MEKIHEDKTFSGIDYAEKKINYREFNNCEFINCNFQKCDLSNNDFVDCTFTGCNLSLALVNNTGIKSVRFIDCKLMGIQFNTTNDFLFSATFLNCHLDYSSFYQKKMKKFQFIDCSLKEVDFAEADMSLALLQNCDLLNASFVRTMLEKADLRTAVNYSFDPELNKIKKAKFSMPAVSGLLSKYNIDIE